VTNYCTLVLHLVHVLAENIQPSSGRPLLQIKAACNMSLNGKNIYTSVIVVITIV
jgi:hypothetical protein